VKDVHKVPALELVGWYTLMPLSGPQPSHLPIHKYILDSYNESAILLGFHPSSVLDGGSAGGKLPLTIYESNYEAEGTSGAEVGEDKEMKDGSEQQIALKFKELPYSVETGEAEMISVDFVARGGGNATAIEIKAAVEDDKDKAKGKKPVTRATGKGESSAKTDENVLSREDEEQIASLTAKMNAIKMLKSRIDLIIAYLQNLPPHDTQTAGKKGDYTESNHQIFRSIQALIQRLILLVPANSIGFSEEILSEQNDVALVSLLSSMTSSVKEIREVGKKHKILDDGKILKGKSGSNWADGGSGTSVLGVGDLMN
jgi:COP9 signalosome complex subunit 6